MIEIDDTMVYEQRCDRLLEAVISGVGDVAFPLRQSVELIVASGIWGEYGAILVLRLDDEDERFMLFDSYVIESDANGKWVCPQSCSGSSLPIAMLERVAHGLPDWQGAEMVFIGSAFRVIEGVPVASISLVFSRAVDSARIRHGEDVLTLTVPDSGFVTVPVKVLSGDDRFWVETAGPQGDLIERISFPFALDGLTQPWQ